MSFPQELLDKLYYYRATLIRVVDADTIEVMIDKGFGDFKGGTRRRKPTLRLARIDAWEQRGEERPRGLDATARVKSLFEQLGPEVIIHTVEEDNFGRWLAEVWLADGTNLSNLLLQEGHAELYKGR